MCRIHLYQSPMICYIVCIMHTYRILVILGSTRKQRLCPQIATWVRSSGEEALPAQYETIDLRDWPLPMDDEPGVPAHGQYVQNHTQRWSEKISSADAVVFVTPQYNWGYPAPLKNALDHLYKEWADMPAMVVTYGGHGGSKCSHQLRQVLDGLHMKPVKTAPGLNIPRSVIEDNSGNIDPTLIFASQRSKVIRAFRELHQKILGK